MIDFNLKIGDTSENGQVTIVDEDRLCYIVRSNSKGAIGLRTISKDLLGEFYNLYQRKSDITANEARDILSGRSQIDKFEYGYASTLLQMAKMVKNVRGGKRQDYLHSYQVIYYGAPGTGKSHKIKECLEGVSNENIFRTTFHPDSDYSTFVGAYKPTMRKQYRYDACGIVKYSDEDDLAGMKKGEPIVERIIEYSFVPQSFLNAYMQAYRKPEEKVYLIIEEINRGNCAQIFGDLFQLLDRDKNGVSEYAIKADADLRAFLKDELGKDNSGIKDGELRLPSNLYIYATMNTSDQSLFPIDSAFKRRWDWEYEPIKYKNIEWVIDIQGNRYSWVDFQKEVNKRIFDATHSEDKMLGDYFVNPANGVITENMLRNKVLFYLWNDVCKDGEGDIFRIKEGNEEREVSFSELHGDRSIQKLLGMMDYLGIEEVEYVNIDSDLEESEERHTRRHLRVEFPDGTILENNNSTESLIQFVNKIGPARILQLNLKVSDFPFISADRIDEDGRGYGKSQKELEGGFYLVTKLSTDAKLAKIQEITQLLNLGIKASIIEV